MQKHISSIYLIHLWHLHCQLHHPALLIRTKQMHSAKLACNTANFAIMGGVSCSSSILCQIQKMGEWAAACAAPTPDVASQCCVPAHAFTATQQKFHLSSARHSCQWECVCHSSVICLPSHPSVYPLIQKRRHPSGLSVHSDNFSHQHPAARSSLKSLHQIKAGCYMVTSLFLKVPVRPPWHIVPLSLFNDFATHIQLIGNLRRIVGRLLERIVTFPTSCLHSQNNKPRSARTHHTSTHTVECMSTRIYTCKTRELRIAPGSEQASGKLGSFGDHRFLTSFPHKWADWRGWTLFYAHYCMFCRGRAVQKLHCHCLQDKQAFTLMRATVSVLPSVGLSAAQVWDNMNSVMCVNCIARSWGSVKMSLSPTPGALFNGWLSNWVSLKCCGCSIRWYGIYDYSHLSMAKFTRTAIFQY